MILACDTSGNSCSACLFEDGKIKAESFLSVGLTHSQTFTPLVEEMRKNTGVEYDEIDVFACAVGPGSFTGIRIGVSAVKTMALLCEKPAVPVSSLEALAYPFLDMKDVMVVPLIDAKNRRVFSCGYLNGNEVIPESAGSVEALWTSFSEIANNRQTNCTTVLLCGNAASLYAGEVEKLGFKVQTADENKREIRSGSVAAIANARIKELNPEQMLERYSPAALSPAYLAKTAAENSLKSVAFQTLEVSPFGGGAAK